MNPRDRRPGDRRSLTPGRPGGAVWYVLGLLFLLALAQAWFMAPQGRQISYSEFKQAVRAGQVAEVFVGDQTIRGTYKRDTNGGRAFNTTRIEDPKLIEDLDAASVKYTGEMVSRWLPEILGWIVPLVLLFGIAMLPKVALERELNDGSLREIAIADMPNPTRQIALISRRSRPLGPVAQAFVDIVTEIFSNERAAAAAATAARRPRRRAWPARAPPSRRSCCSACSRRR